MKLIGLKKCSSCKAIEQLLNELGLPYTYREINLDNPTASELASWLEQSGEADLKKFVNTSGLKYRELDLKNQWERLSQSARLDLLASDGMLVKRPILLTPEGQVYVGPAVRRYLTDLMSE